MPEAELMEGQCMYVCHFTTAVRIRIGPTLNHVSELMIELLVNTARLKSRVGTGAQAVNIRTGMVMSHNGPCIIMDIVL